MLTGSMGRGPGGFLSGKDLKESEIPKVINKRAGMARKDDRKEK